jgi:dephospho-CoA kinase
MIVGLTGGIGSGKSTVARLFEIMGCVIFYSDLVAKQVYYEKEVKKKVTGLLGEMAYKNETEINKAYISSMIFSDTILLHKLNAIIHPAVIEEFNRFADANKGRILVKESALLFEARLTEGLDKIIVVTAPDELRIKRVMSRENVSREYVQKKISSQLPQQEKIKKADYIITNDEEEFLITQVLDIHRQLKQI